MLSPTARAELDAIRAMHGYDEIFAFARAYFPVALTNHYCLLEVDNGNRTIAYMDTLYAGRSVGQVARALADYLLQYEQELTGCTPSPWKIVYSQHMTISKASDLRSTPRQLNGNDCGVYVCAMADCLERGVDIMNITLDCIAKARLTLRQCLMEKNALALITERSADEVFGQVDTVPSPQVASKTLRTPEKKVAPKRTHRTTRNTSVHYGELSPRRLPSSQLRRLEGVALDKCKLAIGPSQQYDGGSELYLDQKSCKPGTILAYYMGRVLTEAEKNASESRYIFEVPTGPDSVVYIDAVDPMSGYARYADDSLCDGAEIARWEVQGTGSDTRLALVATEVIKKGTPIRALYG